MPTLSLYKAIANSLVVLSMFFSGYAWMRRRARLPDMWDMFYWLVIGSALVALLGREGDSSKYYAGLTGNSNYLGWMMAVSLVPVLWKVLDRHASGGGKNIYVLLLALISYYLLQSQSRAAMLIVLVSGLFYLISSGGSRRLLMFGSGTLLVVGIMLFMPGYGDELFAKYALKNTGLSLEDAYQQSRGTPMELSRAGAAQGGLIGAGYGVSIGSDPAGYRGGLSAVGYGREKGNSFLAIVEEVGLVGLVLFVSLLVHFFGCALKAYRLSPTRQVRTLIGLSSGLFFGLIVHSNFEAWFVAPGSAESLFFWGFIGALYALWHRVIDDARVGQRQSSLVGDLSVD